MLTPHNHSALASASEPAVPAPASARDQAPELYPGMAAELARRDTRDRTWSAASVTPLPGPLADAFDPATTTVTDLQGHPITIRPFCHYDFLLLQKLNSPLLHQLRAAATRREGDPDPSTPFSDEDAYELVFQFSMPAREAAAAFAKGRQSFRQAALERIGFSCGIVEVNLLVQAVIAELRRAFSTAIRYTASSASSAESGTVFFQPPPIQTTASAGGSTTSAGSCTPTTGAKTTSSLTSTPSKDSPSNPGPLNQTHSHPQTAPQMPTSPPKPPASSSEPCTCQECQEALKRSREVLDRLLTGTHEPGCAAVVGGPCGCSSVSVRERP